MIHEGLFPSLGSSCLRKKPFESEAQADEFILRQKDTGLHSYKCVYCMYWHIGHPIKPTSKKRRRARRKR